MTRFIAFDVETPNRWNNRMSAIGITVVEEGKITESFCSLVDPLQPFDWFNTQLTGISEETVFGAPTFPELWPTIEPILSSGILVAHNAGFDMRVLRSCLRDNEIEWKKSVKGICALYDTLGYADVYCKPVRSEDVLPTMSTLNTSLRLTMVYQRPSSS